MRNTREVQYGEMPGEAAAMRVPPRNRWQVLLIEYELLDTYWAQLHQRIWMSGLVLVSLTMVGISWMAAIMDTGLLETQRMIGLIGGVSSLLAIGWWFLLRRLFTAQRVAEYRKNEIERELGMRSGLYMTVLRQSRQFGAGKSGALSKRLAEGDELLEHDLREFATSAEARPWLPRFMAERLVWSLVPWLLIAAWAALYVLKA